VDARTLEFLWLELTNRCNLRCVHCYSDSHPGSGGRDLLTTAAYESLLHQAYALGCRRVQFIGGEPQLHPDFLRLLGTAKEIGFGFVEVFSNLTHLREDTVRFAAEAGIHFATSVYSDDPAVHDAVTQVRSSHARTIGNLGRLVERGVATRAAVLRFDREPAAVGRTTAFLRGLGVPAVRAGDVRGFGRGGTLLGQAGGLAGLCGHCWAGKLCVAPDGDGYPCVMAREWTVGNVLDSPLAQIVRGAPLADIRRTIRRTVWAPRAAAGRPPEAHDGAGEPGPGGRDAAEPASDPGGGGARCEPAEGSQSCFPDDLTGCEPLEPCEPEERPAGGPAFPCDVIEFCGPGPCGPELPCPQSCEPLPTTESPECPQSSGPCPQSSG
jgi:MoaA/NifB/PqqE/SkfB family radical SAM enzyme